MAKIGDKARAFHEKHLKKHRECKETTQKVDRVMAMIGVLGPTFTSIQAIHIFSVKNVGGISVYTWIGYILVSICWFIYGFFYKDRPLMIVNSLCVIVDAFIVFGFVLYH